MMNVERKKRLKEAVKTTISRYLESTEDEHMIYGEQAALTWLQNISEKDDLQSLIFQIKVTGFLSIKHYLGEYFKSVEGMENYGARYEQIINEWSLICLVLFQMNLKRKYTKLEYVKSRGAELLAMERRMLLEICNGGIL